MELNLDQLVSIYQAMYQIHQIKLDLISTK